MAKKRRKPRNRPPNPQAPRSSGTTTEERPAGTSGGRPAPIHPRAERKELARQERDRARRQVARSRTIRRVVTVAVTAGVIAIGFFLIFRVSAPGEVSAAALEVGRQAGCTDVQTPAASAPGGQHLQAGEDATYEEFPASSGLHDQAPLPGSPDVYTQPVREEAAVHNLEHGFVMLYYRADGEQALADDVVDRLAQIAESEGKVILAPHAQLDEGTSFAMVAWNKLWECPAGVSAEDAATMATSFIEAYRGTSNAPEGNVSE
jgi:hypothetical protein